MRREEKDAWGEQCYPSQFLSSCLGGTAVTTARTHTHTHQRVHRHTNTAYSADGWHTDTAMQRWREAAREGGREPPYEREWGRGQPEDGMLGIRVWQERETEERRGKDTRREWGGRLRRQGEEALRKAGWKDRWRGWHKEASWLKGFVSERHGDAGAEWVLAHVAL